MVLYICKEEVTPQGENQIMDTMEKLELLRDLLGSEELLESLINSIGLWDIEEHLDYIARNNDIEFEGDEEDDEF